MRRRSGAIDTAQMKNRRHSYVKLATVVDNVSGTSFGGRARLRAGRREGAAAYCKSRLGGRFIRTVFEAHDRGDETFHDVMTLLDIRMGDVDYARSVAEE